MSVKELFKKYIVDPPEQGRVQLVRSLAVGAAATVVDFVALIVLKEFLGFRNHTTAAVCIAFILGLLTNYLLSTFWAFRGLGTRKRGVEIVVFIIISLIGLVLNDVIVRFFEEFLGPRAVFGSALAEDKYYIIGKIVATVVVFIWNFGMRKLLLYRGKKKTENNEENVDEKEA